MNSLIKLKNCLCFANKKILALITCDSMQSLNSKQANSFKKEIKFKGSSNKTNEEEDDNDSSLIDSFTKGQYLYTTYQLNRIKNERVSHYLSEDDELDPHFHPQQFKVEEKLNFTKFSDNVLKDQFFRA